MFALSAPAIFGARDAFAHGISAAAQQRMLEGGYFQYGVLGAEHMLTGYDHLLFLLGVVFYLKSLRDVVGLVTAFTLGHSITLIFATFAGVQANYYLIDAVIALSVVYMGFENSGGFRRYLNAGSPNLLAAVFAFGLIHGFGLSTRLQQLPLGEPGLAMLGRIVTFNVGVEVGQIVALIVMVALLRLWRKRQSFTTFGRVANHGLVAAGALLFVSQMHGYVHTAAPGDFGFDTDAHAHAHEAVSGQPHTHGEGPPHTHGPGGHAQDDVFPDEVARRARLQLDELVVGEMLDSSWKAVGEPSIEQKPFKGEIQWVAVFRHPSPRESGRERLYVFFTRSGAFLAANHTGK